MSIDDLPDELIQVLAEQWPCRDLQLKQLSVLLSPILPSPSTIVVQGPHATGKTVLLRAYLEAITLPNVIIHCAECVTERHLLERIVSAVESAVIEKSDDHTFDKLNGRCENLNALASCLQVLVAGLSKFVLVVDGVDKEREASVTLGPALARLGEVIPNLVTVLVVQDSLPGTWRKLGVPHIPFPAYSREQAIHIVSQRPLDIFTSNKPAVDGYSDKLHQEDKAWLWPRFCVAIWDSIGQNAARDLISFRDLCHKLWRPFVAPIIDGDLGTRDFSRLMVVQRKLLQDENVLLNRIVEAEDGLPAKLQLPYYAKWLLLAAFLASTNPARLDPLYFMKTTEKKRSRKGGAGRSSAKSSQTNKMPRHLMAPTPFHLDRLISILHAILPDDVRSNIDVYTQITTLTSLRLLARSAGLGFSDSIEAGSKWKIGHAVTWELVSSLAGSLGFTIADYMAG